MVRPLLSPPRSFPCSYPFNPMPFFFSFIRKQIGKTKAKQRIKQIAANNKITKNKNKTKIKNKQANNRNGEKVQEIHAHTHIHIQNLYGFCNPQKLKSRDKLKTSKVKQTNKQTQPKQSSPNKPI